MADDFDASAAVDAYLGSKAPGEPVAPANMRSSLAVSIGVNPDAQAEAQRVARRTGVPVDTVLAQPDEMKKKAALSEIDFDSYAKMYPASAALLADTGFAKLAHDDMDNMGQTEGAFGTLRAASGPKPSVASTAYGLFSALGTGVDLTEQGLRQQFADAMGWKRMSEDAQLMAERSRFKQFLADPAFESSTAQGIYSGGRSVVQMVPGLIGAAATRSSAPLLAAAGVQTETDSYTKYRARGATPEEAVIGALGEGAIEVATEKLPMGFIVDRFGKTGAKQFIAGFLERELAGEELATLTQDAIDTAIANPDKTWGDYMAERPEAAYQTALGTLVTAGVFESANELVYRVSGERAKAQRAEENAKTLEQINHLAAASKLRERDPESFRRFIEAANENSPVQDVYIDVKELAQAGIDPAELAKVSPSVALQLNDAVANGSDLRIPVGEYATNVAGTDLGQALIDHLKTDPEGMSRKQAGEFMQNESAALEAEVQKVLTEKQGDESFKASREAVYNDLLGQLGTANRFTTDVNAPYATMLSNFYAVQAARSGATPEEMYKQYPVKIQAESVAGPQLDELSQKFYRGVSENTGTNAARYGKGLYFTTTKKGAKVYAGDKGKVVEIPEQYLPKNPLTFRSADAFDVWLTKEYEALGYKRISEFNKDHPDMGAFIKAKGYDGVKIGSGKDVDYVTYDAPVFNQGEKTNGQVNAAESGRGAVDAGRGDNAVREAAGSGGTSPQGDGGVRELNQSPTFYSALEKSLTELPQPKGSAEQWSGIIKNLTNKGVKQEEIDWTGVQDWLKSQKGSVTKEQVLDYLRANAVQVEEVVKGDDSFARRTAESYGYEYDRDLSGDVTITDAQGDEVPYEKLPIPLQRALSGMGGDTKFGKYTLPGGENYRELLMTLPEREPRQLNDIAQELYGKRFSELGDDEANQVVRREGEQKRADNYRSGHYDERNILAHIRFNERTDADGKRVMFIEEVQSDWHQAGRDKGYKTSDAESNVTAARNAYEGKVEELRKQGLAMIQRGEFNAGRIEEDESNDGTIKYYVPILGDVKGIGRESLEDAQHELAKRWAESHPTARKLREALTEANAAAHGVPDAPFKTSWPELAFKRALMWAVENNFDRVAWTTGEQQAERYDLSKQVGGVTYQPDNQRLIVTDKGGSQILNKTGVDYQGLADYIGKEAAEKIKNKAPDEWVEVKEFPNRGWAAVTNHGERGILYGEKAKAEADLKRMQEATRNAPREITLSGDGLKVGGEGMKGFYDKMLPSMVNKLVKKWGGKVEQTDLGLSKTNLSYQDILSKTGLSDQQWNALTPQERKAKLSEIGGAQTVHALDITPAMRESIRQGLPLFQGNRGSFNPSTNTITLLKAADLSTFLHEAGHFFLETMNKMALDPNAPAEIKADMDRVLKWFGVPDLATWNALSLDEQRDFHEKFARGFEAYLFEGKSPSVEMAGVFQRFRAWLLNVYKSLTNLNVKLSDDVRGVFDRMLATSEQIKEAEDMRQFEQMFKSAQEAGMTEEEWKAYQELGNQATQDAISNLETRSLRDMQWLSNARNRTLKAMQRDAEVKRRAIRKEVTDEVMAEPVNQARAFLKRRKVEGEEADAVAEMFGFTSGDHLNKALAEAENPKDKIAGLTDQRMLERYGDLTDPAAIARAADAAIHNDARTRFVATELNALQKAVGGRKLLTRAAKDYAAQMINRLRVRDIKPARYASAEVRAAKAAEKARASGDLQTAAVEKRNQLIQNYATRAAYEAQDAIEKGLIYLAKFSREGSRKKIDVDYLDQIDALLERFDLRKATSLKTIDKRKSLLDWVEAQKEMGLEPDIDPAMLDAANRKHFKDMTVEEMNGLIDTVKQIEHLGRLKNTLLTAKDNRDFAAVVEKLVASVILNAENKRADNRTRPTAADRAARLFKGYLASHRKVASLARELDGFADGGAMWETFIRSMNEAGNNEAAMREQATKKLAALIKPVLAQGKMGGKGQFFPSVGRSLNREERIGIALNTGNLGNFQRLLDGEGWTHAQVAPVLDTLSKEDWDAVQNIWDFFESYRPQIAAKERRIYGKEPVWVEANPVHTKYGELRGGYYPIKYDTRLSGAAEQFDAAETAKQQLRGAFTSSTTRRSFTKTRAEEVKNRPLLYTLDGLFQGTNEVIHDLAWHEWLIDANKILRNRSVDNAIRTRYGADVVGQFKSAVTDIAGGEMPANDALEKALGSLRAGSMIAGLGFNLLNSVINLTGVSQSIVRVGPKWVAMGVGEWARNPRALVREIHSKSEFMRLRSQTQLREINEIRSRVQGKSDMRQAIDRALFMPLTFTQLAVDTPTWWGAYQKALADGNEDARAVDLADQAVIDAQGGGQVKDLAAIQRGGPIKKLLTTFYGFFSTTYNLSAEAVNRTDFKDPLSVMRLGGDYLLLYTMPALLGTLIKQALTGGEDDPEKLAKLVINDQISYMLGTMVGLREVTGAVQKAAGVQQFSSTYGGPAGLRFFQEIDKLGQQIGQGEVDRALARSAINVAGVVLHLPSSQINRTIDGIAAIASGRTANPLAPLVGAPAKK